MYFKEAKDECLLFVARTIEWIIVLVREKFGSI